MVRQQLFGPERIDVDDSLTPRDAKRLAKDPALENMKGLGDLSALETAPALEDVIYVEAQGKVPAHMLPALRNPSVRRVSAGFGSDRKNEEFARLRDEHGKAPLNGLDTFEYR